jgi:hypothetical protein
MRRTAAYLPTYSGNIGVGNLNVTGNVTATYFVGIRSILLVFIVMLVLQIIFQLITTMLILLQMVLACKLCFKLCAN